MKVLSVNCGRVREVSVDGRKVGTAIGKRPVDGPVAVRPLGLEGDEQGDLSRHGGLSKAVYAYPSEHFAFWRTVRAQAKVALWDDEVAPGLVGENLTLEGLTEAQLWVGDRLVLPGCVLAVSEPRFPCFMFNAAMGFKQAAALMWQSGYCGSYLAVVQPGTVCAGDDIRLEPGPRDVSIAELFRARAPSLLR